MEFCPEVKVASGADDWDDNSEVSSRFGAVLEDSVSGEFVRNNPVQVEGRKVDYPPAKYRHTS